MSFLEITLVGIALAMDAFAVSVSKGLSMGRKRYGDMFVIALFFGCFQAFMPILGWHLGTSVSALVDKYDHWVGFLLLAVIGTKNLVDALKKEPDDSPDGEAAAEYKGLNIGELFLLALATSIDAFAVGVSFALGYSLNIYRAAAIIGIVTFLISCIGVLLGRSVGTRYEKKAGVAGGLILIAIGLRILFDGLGLFL